MLVVRTAILLISLALFTGNNDMTNTYFPLCIQMVDTGELRRIEWEEVPNGESFRVLETNCTPERFAELQNENQLAH